MSSRCTCKGKLPNAVMSRTFTNQLTKKIEYKPFIYTSAVLIYVVANILMLVVQPLKIFTTQAPTPLEPSKTEATD